MPPDEYAPTTRGTLKLKGVKDSKVDKKKKKKKKAEDTEGPSRETELPATPQGGEGALDNEGARQGSEARDGEDKDAMVGTGKTEAEIRHEEMRKKRLDERLKREGVKTHKERVEELNKYLSNLSEHHDMPKSDLAKTAYNGQPTASNTLQDSRTN